MRAKLINEIKRNIEGSCLDTIGIGKTHLTKTAIHMEKKFPGIVSERRLGDDLKKYVKTVKSNRDQIEDRLRIIKDRLGNLNDYVVLNIPEDVERYQESRKIKDYIQTYFLDDDTIQYEMIVNDDYYRNRKEWEGSYLCYANLEDGIGCISLSDLVPPKNNYSVFFVRN